MQNIEWVLIKLVVYETVDWIFYYLLNRSQVVYVSYFDD